MKPIELERWEPSPDDPRRKVYAGQRTAQEVFEELKYRLENMGYLPDEYFLLNREWENGREIPKDADIFCTTDYGGSEGIYTDLYLKWYQDGDPVITSFATGKTLGESGSDLDRMYLIASAITKAFHGDRGTYARYLRWGEQPEPEDMILHLNPAEQRTFINALVEQRERQEQAVSQTEQLLRRMTGSITAYMDEVGQRPLRLSDYDKAVLAIRDGEFEAFSSLYPRVPDRADDLLIEAAGRPGRTGGNMVRALLSAVGRFSPEAYLTACKRAVETGDSQRVRTMVEEAACVVLPYFKCKYDLKSTTNDYGLMDYGAAWALIENLLLAATAEGLGSVVHIPVKKEPEQIKKWMSAPDGYILPALVLLGYAAQDAQVPAQVKATVENKVHWNKW